MGLLDSVLGQVLGGANAPQQNGGAAGMGDLGALAGALGGLLANDGAHGGLGGLLTKFEQAGLGQVAASWVGTGQNQPVSETQLSQALGPDTIAGLAGKLGINAQTLLPLLTAMLPMLIDKLTPQGQVPAQGVGNQNDLLASLGSLLQKG